jgi:hypothetical protein
MVAIFDGLQNFWSWAVWVWFILGLFAVLEPDFQALIKPNVDPVVTSSTLQYISKEQATAYPSLLIIALIRM